jgi:hypothetical protein
MGKIGIQNLSLTERNSRLLLGLMSKKLDKETESEDKLDVVHQYNKRTEEPFRRLEPD